MNQDSEAEDDVDKNQAPKKRSKSKRRRGAVGHKASRERRVCLDGSRIYPDSLVFCRTHRFNVFKRVPSTLCHPKAKRQKTQPSEYDPFLAAAARSLMMIDSQYDLDTVIVAHVGMELTWGDMLRLRPTAWLNDEVINTICLQLTELLSPVHRLVFLNTHFYSLLSDKGRGYDYDRVSRWVRDYPHMLEYRTFIIVHQHAHFILVVVDHRSRSLTTYDSYGVSHLDVLNLLEQFYQTLANNPDSWTKASGNMPAQSNGTDCGVFAAWPCFVLRKTNR